MPHQVNISRTWKTEMGNSSLILVSSDCFEPWFPSATVMWYCTHLNESEDSWILTAWSLTVWSSPSRDAPFLNTLNLVIGTLDTRKLIGTVLKEDFWVPLVVQRPERLNSFSWATPHALLEKTELYLKSFFPLFCPNILGNSSWPLLNSVLVQQLQWIQLVSFIVTFIKLHISDLLSFFELSIFWTLTSLPISILSKYQVKKDVIYSTNTRVSASKPLQLFKLN